MCVMWNYSTAILARTPWKKRFFLSQSDLPGKIKDNKNIKIPDIVFFPFLIITSILIYSLLYSVWRVVPNISLHVVLCMIVYVTNKVELELVISCSAAALHSWTLQN